MSSFKQKIGIAVAWDFIGTIGLKGIGFVISIFLARLLDPVQFGMIGMAMVFISISQVFIDFGFASALIQNKENTNLTYSSIFYVNFLAGIILTLSFYLLAPLIGNFYNNTEITDLVRWLSLIFVFNSLNIVQTSILRRNLNFKLLSMIILITNSLGGVVGIIFAFKGFGVYSLVIQQLMAAALGTILLWTKSEWSPNLKFSIVEVKKLTGFSTFAFFDQFVSTIFQRLDILIIGKVFSPAILGYYTRAVSLKDQVVTYSSSTFIKVFYPVLSALQDDDEEYRRIYFKVLSVISFISYLLTGILYVLGAEVITGLFGAKWFPSVPIFQVLILSVCNYPINSMIINAFMSKGKSKENFLIGLFRKGISIIPLLIAYFYGIFEFTVAVVIISYFLTLINIFFLKRYVGLSISVHFKKMLEGIVPLVLVVLVFHAIPQNTLIINISLALVYILFYLGYNYFIKSEGLIFIHMNIRTQIEKRIKNIKQ